MNKGELFSTLYKIHGTYFDKTGDTRINVTRLDPPFPVLARIDQSMQNSVDSVHENVQLIPAC